jgi:hypothetical protein
VAHLKPTHIDGWFRNWTKGYGEKQATVTVSGKVLNLQSLFEKVCGRYADWVMQMKIEPAWRNGADSVLEVGGVALHRLEGTRLLPQTDHPRPIAVPAHQHRSAL